MAVQEQETEMVAAVHNPQSGAQQRNITHVQDVVEHNVRVAAFTAQHMTEFVRAATR